MSQVHLENELIFKVYLAHRYLQKWYGQVFFWGSGFGHEKWKNPYPVQCIPIRFMFISFIEKGHKITIFASASGQTYTLSMC